MVNHSSNAIVTYAVQRCARYPVADCGQRRGQQRKRVIDRPARGSCPANWLAACVTRTWLNVVADVGDERDDPHQQRAEIAELRPRLTNCGPSCGPCVECNAMNNCPARNH
jgi:hypothetical protein